VNTWENIKLMVLSIIGVFLNLITGNMEGLKISLLGIWTAIKNQVINIITMFKDMAINIFTAWKNGVMIIANAIWTGLTAIWNGIKTGAVAIWNGLVNGITAIITGLKNGAVNSVNAIKNGIVNGFESAKNMAVNTFNAMKNGVSNAIQGVIGFVTGMKDKVISTVKGIDLKQIGINVIEGFINGIKSMVGAVGKAIKSVAEGVTNKIKGALGIHSPSRVFMEIGQFTGEGLGIGIQKMQSFVQDATQTLADASFGTINSQELNPITTTVEPVAVGQGGQGETTNNSLNIQNYYQNTNTDARALSTQLFGMDRASKRKKGK
jgi:phage-related protein